MLTLSLGVGGRSHLVEELAESDETKSRAETQQAASVGDKFYSGHFLVPQNSCDEGILRTFFRKHKPQQSD